MASAAPVVKRDSQQVLHGFPELEPPHEPRHGGPKHTKMRRFINDRLFVVSLRWIVVEQRPRDLRYRNCVTKPMGSSP